MDQGASLAIRQLLADRDQFRAFFIALRKDVFRGARRRFPWVRDADVEACLHDAMLGALEGRSDFALPPDARDDRARLAAHLGAHVRSATTQRLIERLVLAGHATRIDTAYPDDPLDRLLAEAGHAPMLTHSDVERERRVRIAGECLQRLPELARQTIGLALLGRSDTEIQVSTGASSAIAARRRVSEAKNLLARAAQSSWKDAA